MEADLTFFASFGMTTFCKPGVTEAVAMYKRAGITVRFISGTNIINAMHIAKEAGIYHPANLEEAEQRKTIMEAPDFENAIDQAEQNNDNNLGRPFKNLEAMENAANKLTVVSRAHPSTTHRFVEGLQYLGHSVAVTAKDSGFAPCLVKADVGIAHGSGTETI